MLCRTLIFLLLPFLGYGAEVKQAEMRLQGVNYVLTADIVFQLSEKSKDALQNGVPLFWDLQIKLLQHRDFLWDKKLVYKSIRYSIQYLALLNMYRVRNEDSGEFYNFSTLPAALGLMSSIAGFPVIDKLKIDPEKKYVCFVKINFDRNSLPLPLRPIAYIDAEWYLSSDWMPCPLKK
jgi:hypothetical protein